MTRNFYPLYSDGQKAKYAKGIIVGNIAFLSGVTAWAPVDGQYVDDHELTESTNATDQTKIIMSKIHQNLSDMGLSLENVIKHTVYIKSGEDVDEVLKELREYYYANAPIMREEPPAATLVLISGLHSEKMKVEIEIIAEVPEVT